MKLCVMKRHVDILAKRTHFLVDHRQLSPLQSNKLQHRCCKPFHDKQCKISIKSICVLEDGMLSRCRVG